MEFTHKLNNICIIICLIISGTFNIAMANERSKAKNLVSDTAITTAIKSKYAIDNEVSALDIKVETVNGKVTLSGKANNAVAAERAISIAKNTKGVTKVTYKWDHVWHAPDKHSTAGNLLSDTAITTAVKTNLARDDSASALDIKVETINKKVILSGKVSSISAANHVIQIAKDTEGVRSVKSNLDIAN